MVKRGYTIVELIVALAVLCILIIPISDIVNAIIKMNKQSEDLIEATSVMNECIEYTTDYLERYGSFDIDYFNNYGLNVDKKYKAVYKQLKTEVKDTPGIQNDKPDISITVSKDSENKYKLNFYKGLPGQNVIGNQVDLSGGYEIKIRAAETSENPPDGQKLQYNIKDMDDNNICSVTVDNPLYGIYIDGSQYNGLSAIFADGVYKSDGSVDTEKSICVNYINVDENNTKLISILPYVMFYKYENGKPVESEEKRSINQIAVSIIDKGSGKVIKTQEFYAAYRLK